jgi:hypothetical protein
MATQYPPNPFADADQQPKFVDCFDHVLTAGWLETAVLAQQR